MGNDPAPEHPGGQPAQAAADEALCRALIENTSEGILRVDAQGRLVFANARLAAMTGYGHDELLSMHISALHPAEDQGLVLVSFGQRRAGIPGKSEYRILRKDGAIVWILLSSSPQFDAGGAFLGVIGIASDISERKRREEINAHERRLLRQISGNYPLAAVAEDLCRALEELSRRPLHCAVMFVGADGRSLECIAAPSLPAHFREDRVATLLEGSGTACAQAVRSGMPAIVADTAAPDMPPLMSEMRRNFGFGAVWSYPIVSDDEVLGTLALFPLQAGAPDEEDERLIGFALQVARLALAHERNVKALRNSEQRFRDFADQAADWFWEQDAEFRFTLVINNPDHRSDAPADIPKEVIGKHRWELGYLDVPPDYWEKHRRLLEAGGAFSDLRFKRRMEDGALRHIEISGRPVFDAQGRVSGYRGAGRDITAQEQTLLDLGRAKEDYRRLFESNPNPMWIFDPETLRFVEVNQAACEHYGYSREEFQAMRITDIRPPEDLPRLQAYLTQAKERALKDAGIWRHRRKDGTEILVRVTRSDIRYRERDARIIMVQDVTEQVRTEERIRELNATLEARVKARTAALEAANRELDAFNYSVSHDLRAPLRSIDGFSKVLLEDYDARLDEEGRDYLARIRAAAQRMGGLIDAMYQLSKLSRSLMQIREVDLSDMARTVLAELREHNPGREVEADIAGKLVAEGDAGLLNIVLVNLLGNAWKYTGRTAKARIEFGARSNGDGLPVFYVKDNGAGFDMQFQDKLFKLFQRLHRDEEFAGHGVGLATVQRIVRRHGGRIWADAEKGRGATFCFTLWENPVLRREAEEETLQD